MALEKKCDLCKKELNSKDKKMQTQEEIESEMRICVQCRMKDWGFIQKEELEALKTLYEQGVRAMTTKEKDRISMVKHKAKKILHEQENALEALKFVKSYDKFKRNNRKK